MREISLLLVLVAIVAALAIQRPKRVEPEPTKQPPTVQPEPQVMIPVSTPAPEPVIEQTAAFRPQYYRVNGRLAYQHADGTRVWVKSSSCSRGNCSTTRSVRRGPLGKKR